MNCPHCDVALAAEARFCPACGKAAGPTETRADTSGPIPHQREGDLVGREIAGRFRILAKLGEGGMGAVYRGEQISLKRAVAVKVLRPELSANKMLQRRFSIEAAAVAKLDHPNTVKVHDFGEDTDGSLFIVMEYIEGRSLRAAIGQGPMTPARALGVAVQVAASLADAHAQSIVHRDLKPDNVMLIDKGRARDIVRVLDFGIAKLRDDSRATQAAMTQAGDMLGTPQYMAPEQIRGETIDGRTDVYALGCLIYEMVTARLPFEAATILAMLTKHLTEPVPPPSVRRPDLGLPPAIDQLVLIAMQKDPKARPPTMDQYGEMLAAALQTLPADPSRGASVGMPALGASPLTPVPYAQTPVPDAAPSMEPHSPSGVLPGGGTPRPSPPSQTPAPMQQVYTPSPIPPTTRSVPPPRVQPPTKSRAPIYAVVGVLAIGGAGLVVWAATRGGSATTSATTGSGSSTTTVADTHRAPAGGEHDVPIASPNDTWAVPDQPVTVTPPPPARRPASRSPTPTPTPTPTTTPPPVAPPPPPTPVVEIGTAETPVPRGARLSVPTGFTGVSNSTGIAYVDNSRGILIVLAPLHAGTNDPDQLSALWVRDNAQFHVSPGKSTTLPIHGVNRPALSFSATVNGVLVAQLALLYITPSYRLGFLIQAPATLFGQASFQTWVGNYINNGITLP